MVFFPPASSWYNSLRSSTQHNCCLVRKHCTNGPSNFSCAPERLPHYEPASPNANQLLERGEAGKEEPAVTPEGALAAWIPPRDIALPGTSRPRKVSSAVKLDLLQKPQPWVCLDAGSTHDLWFSQSVSVPASQLLRPPIPRESSWTAASFAKVRKKKQRGSLAFSSAQQSWESCSGYAVGNMDRLYKHQNLERRDQENTESQQPYLQLSVQSCTRPRRKTCTKHFANSRSKLLLHMSPTAQMETAKKVTCLSSPATSACSSTFSLTWLRICKACWV